jgi:hypothetical protein
VTGGFTADQIEAGIARALRDRELTVIPSLIKLLAVKDPPRAQAVFDTISAGLALAKDFDLDPG